MDEKALIEGLLAGLVREEQLEWADYQRLVSHVIRRQNLSLLASSDVTISDNETSGAIDIVIRYMSPAIQIGADSNKRQESIFVECKRRQRKLELDDVGKVFCYSIMHQPRALYIVSPFPLGPQAIECARHLFAVDGATPGFLRQTALVHRTLRELLGPNATARESGTAEIRVQTWSVTVEDVFRRDVVADDGHSPAVIEVPSGATVSFAFQLESDDSASVSAQLACGESLLGRPMSVVVNGSISLELRLDIRSSLNVDGVSFAFTKPERMQAYKLPRMEFVLASSASAFGDLRAEEAGKIVESLAMRVGVRIAAISGDAGIGKSYLCETIARQLKKKHGFHTFRAVFTANEDYYVFLALIRHLFIPISDSRKSDGSRPGSVTESELELVSQTLSHVSGSAYSPEDLGELFARILAGRHAAADPAILSDVIESAVRLCPTPQLLVLKDCHLMSPRAAAMLQQLAGRLLSGERQRVRLVLEARDREQPANRSWDETVVALQSAAGDGFLNVRVEPLTLDQTIDRVCNQIEAPSPQATAQVLMRQAGGNPLFLEHIMRDLLQSRVVVRDDSGGKFYRIDHFELFRRRIETLPRELDAFLRYRVDDVLARTPAELQPSMAAYLGLAAVVGSGAGALSQKVPEARIAVAVGQSEEFVSRLRHRLVADGVMTGSLRNPPAEFVHDLMMAAALASVRRLGSFRDAALAYCALLNGESADDAVACGRLSLILGRSGEAVSFFEGGLHLAEANSNFLEQRRCLEGLREVFAAANATDPVSVAHRSTVWMKLVWNELQQGSQYAAEKFIHQARREIRNFSTPDVQESGIDILCERELSRYQVVLDTRRGDVAKFEKSARHYIEVATQQRDIHYAATRVLLMSVHLCLPEPAWEAAQLAITSLPVPNDPTAVSSLYSDVGQLFIVSRPSDTQLLWRAGLEAIDRPSEDLSDRRQHAHSRVNVSIISAILHPGLSQLGAMTDLCRELAALGLMNPLLKLQNCLGALRMHLGDPEGAEHEWRKGLQIARSSSMRFYEWPYLHNLAIATLMRGRPDEAVQLINQCASVLSIFGPYAAKSEIVEPLLVALRKKLHSAKIRRSAIQDFLRVAHHNYEPVTVCGSIVRFFQTCTDFREVTGCNPISGWTPQHTLEHERCLNGQPALMAEGLGRRFLLAVE
jgi:hypothetical protein